MLGISYTGSRQEEKAYSSHSFILRGEILWILYEAAGPIKCDRYVTFLGLRDDIW